MSESRAETSGNFLNAVLEKDGEDYSDRSCEKVVVLQRAKEERNILHAIKKEG